MNVYRNDNGVPVVRVPGTLWYTIVGKNRYEFAPIVHREIRNYDRNIEMIDDFVGNIKTRGLYGTDINGGNSDSTKKLVKQDEDYVSCVNYYARDKRGELLRCVDNVTFSMRRGTVVDIPKEVYPALKIKKGYWVPFSDGEWHKTKKINKNGEVLFMNGELRDLDYIVSEMIQYMHDRLNNQSQSCEMS